MNLDTWLRPGRGWPLLIILHLGLYALALGVRPLLPVDETRYVGVAWEMWAAGEFLVPLQNGEPYSHKPPLLFWLQHAGWALFGVSEWWPRLLPVLVSLASLALIAGLARRLWPQTPVVAALAPWLAFASFGWLGIFTLVQFDLLLCLATLIGVHALLDAEQGRGPWRGWPVFALALGLGGLIKGPVILVHLLPLALLYPFWAGESRALAPGAWYARLILALAGGLFLALAWAWPAARAGGADYAQALFIGQTAGRLVESFAHAEPGWFYLPVLALLLVPWLWWPRLWPALRAGAVAVGGQPLRLLLAWGLPALLILSLVSGKQAKYLLPALPAALLWLAAVLAAGWRPAPARRLLGPGLWLGMAGLAALLLWWLRAGQSWLVVPEPFSALALLGLGAVLPTLRSGGLRVTVQAAGLAMALGLAGAHLSVIRWAGPAYDLRAPAATVAAALADGQAVAWLGRYHGELHFAGRLTQPLRALPHARLQAWLGRQSRALVLADAGDAPWLRRLGLQPQAHWPYRSSRLELWRWSPVNFTKP